MVHRVHQNMRLTSSRTTRIIMSSTTRQQNRRLPTVERRPFRILPQGLRLEPPKKRLPRRRHIRHSVKCLLRRRHPSSGTRVNGTRTRSHKCSHTHGNKVRGVLRLRIPNRVHLLSHFSTTSHRYRTSTTGSQNRTKIVMRDDRVQYHRRRSPVRRGTSRGTRGRHQQMVRLIRFLLLRRHNTGTTIRRSVRSVIRRHRRYRLTMVVKYGSTHRGSKRRH